MDYKGCKELLGTGRNVRCFDCTNGIMGIYGSELIKLYILNICRSCASIKSQ